MRTQLAGRTLIEGFDTTAGQEHPGLPRAGFAVLEVAGGFGFTEDLDATYQSLIHMVIASLHAERER
jgi:hypothetical protein